MYNTNGEKRLKTDPTSMMCKSHIIIIFRNFLD